MEEGIEEKHTVSARPLATSRVSKARRFSDQPRGLIRLMSQREP